ncbi:hypothetical protein KO516_21550 [Citreicella sp. C3M06]|uniref:hypothetical protein n=1 Tax=Citreicella sp. C3M06 TaxID=2841564 RepID=UPI001C090981|nr:hypothetical protein [Citreicella sp. C3M06]MBU2963362.1 hypothetical protein [Citreicella sp. C3M06]
MKYILIQNPDGIKTAITFPEHIVHSNMARYVKGVGRAVSAGSFDPIKHETSGRSDSLRLHSRAVDAGYILFGAAVRTAPERAVEHMLAQWRSRFSAPDLAAQIADSHAAEARMNGDLTGATIARQIAWDIRAAGKD